MNEKVKFLIQIQDLCLTVCEGISYFADHMQDSSVKEDIQAGIAALKGYTSSIAPAKSDDNIWSELEAEFSPAKMNASRISAMGKQLSEWCSKTISKALSQIIQDRAYIDCDTAEQIYHFYDCAEHLNIDIYLLIFDVCMKSGVSAPEKSFEYMIKIFQERPALFSGQNMPHPNYIFQAAEQKTFEKCPICGGRGTPYYNAFAYQMADFRAPHLPAKLWMRCGSCENLYTWKYPEALLKGPEQERCLYPRAEYSLDTTAETHAGILSIWSNILNKLRSYTQGNSLLEVGVGGGELVAVALELAYEVDAVEIVESMAQKVADMLGLPVWNGDFLRYHTDKTYSIIIMGDVIEHVTDPGKALTKAHQLLEEDGVLWLSTPNFESSFSKMRKFHDPMWCEPFHISYFSRRGFISLAEQCGFQVQEYCVSSRYNGSMELILTKKQRNGEKAV